MFIFGVWFVLCLALFMSLKVRKQRAEIEQLKESIIGMQRIIDHDAELLRIHGIR